MTNTAEITKRALDAFAVSQDLFIITAQNILELAKKGDLGESPLMFGHSIETQRPMGVVYVIPQAKRRAAFPLFWDTEPKKFLHPKLFQALGGPSWPQTFNAEVDANTGTMHLDPTLVADSEKITDLPDMIDGYLDQRFPEKGLLLMYRPMFTSVDRFRLLHVPSDADMDQSITKYIQELYGFYPTTDIPLAMATKATEGVPAGYGIPAEVKTASADEWRYVAAEDKKAAQKKTRLYTTYGNACDYASDKAHPIFRVRVVDGTPEWKSAKEVHSLAEDTVTKMASNDSWLRDMEKSEVRKLRASFSAALNGESQQVVI